MDCCNNILSDIACILTIISFIFFIDEIYKKLVKLFNYLHSKIRNSNKIMLNNNSSYTDIIVPKYSSNM